MRKPANDEGVGSWDHRVIDHGSWLGIHEVNYDAQGRPAAFTPAAVGIIVDVGEGAAAMRETLEQMRGALEKPVLRPEDFP